MSYLRNRKKNFLDKVSVLILFLFKKVLCFVLTNSIKIDDDRRKRERIFNTWYYHVTWQFSVGILVTKLLFHIKNNKYCYNKKTDHQLLKNYKIFRADSSFLIALRIEVVIPRATLMSSFSIKSRRDLLSQSVSSSDGITWLSAFLNLSSVQLYPQPGITISSCSEGIPL